MKQKINGSTGEQNLEYGIRNLTFEDKYGALKFENQKLKTQLRNLGDAFSYWKELALQYQAERDYYRELAQAHEGI